MRRWREHRRTRWAAIGAAVAVTAATTSLLSAGTAAAAGPDLSVSMAGNFPQAPNSGGNIGLMWRNVGTAEVTGPTHLTIDFPVGMNTSGGYIVVYTFTYTQTVSPTGGT